MPAFVCTTCGMQYASSEAPPAQCRVCEDERQFTPPGGQSWTTLDLLAARHLNAFRQHEPGLIGIGTMPHWAAGAEGRGVVCSADIARVNSDRKSFTFMRSYPNNIPLSEKGVRAIGAALGPFQFDRVYSHFFDLVMPSGAKRILQASIERYVGAIAGVYDQA